MKGSLPVGFAQTAPLKKREASAFASGGREVVDDGDLVRVAPAGMVAMRPRDDLLALARRQDPVPLGAQRPPGRSKGSRPA
ncbi:MAG TPA: hypothetical protein VK325_03525, partial [Pseudoxanthomonas sp.]|nr:hypothetical protein [Pseudoxanthomonas sp.]